MSLAVIAKLWLLMKYFANSLNLFLFFFLDKKEPKNQENLKLPNALAALPAKFSGRRARIPKEIV
jgi:hypothetical protein